MKNRKSRLPVIVEILNDQNIGSQEELSRQLAARGFIVTQATLSRDLKMLRTTKVATEMGGYRYVVAEDALQDEDNSKNQNSFHSGMHPATLSLSISGNIVVIKTRNGYASGLAYDMDMLQSEHLLGTIPGADTVFAVVNEKSTRRQLLEFFASFLPKEVIDEARAQFEN